MPNPALRSKLFSDSAVFPDWTRNATDGFLGKPTRCPAGRDPSGRSTAVRRFRLLGFYAYQHWTAAPASPLIGRARVLDGDSLEISGARIRLEGIDAPEWRQTCVDPKGQMWSCGQTAAQELRSYIGGRELTCARHGVDRYNRILATCSVPDGSDVNAWIIRQGWAVASGDAGHYRSEQHEAEAAKRGIWSGTFLLPREWRRQHPE
jgi:endonuclease YncB( thermonuclease family)